ncbi:unnamed protein product [Sympodiomycopsis kandeliae]
MNTRGRTREPSTERRPRSPSVPVTPAEAQATGHLSDEEVDLNRASLSDTVNAQAAQIKRLEEENRKQADEYIARLDAFEERMKLFMQQQTPVLSVSTQENICPTRGTVRHTMESDADLDTDLRTPAHRERTEHTRLKASDLPTFHGLHDKDSGDIDDWIERIEAIYEYSGASESKLLATFPLIFKDNALTWFTGLRERRTELRTWLDWQDALRSRFRPPNFRERITLALTRRRLRDNESFDHYFEERLALINKKYRRDATDNIRIEEILDGLPSDMVPLILASMGNTRDDLEHLRRTMVNLEVGLRANTRGQRRTDNRQNAHHNINRSYLNDGQHAAPRRDPPRQEQRQHGYQNSAYRPNNAPQQNRPNAPAPVRNTLVSGVTCYNCGKPGHISTQCQSPRVTRAQTAPPSRNNAESNFSISAPNRISMPHNRWQQNAQKSAFLVNTRANQRARETHQASPQKDIELQPTETQSQDVYLDYTPALANTVLPNGQSHAVCIDSGSSISLMDTAFLKRNYPNVSISNCSSFSASGIVSGSQITSYAEVPMRFTSYSNTTLCATIRFYLLALHNTKVIIGNDALLPYKASIDTEKGHLIFGKAPQEKIPLRLTRGHTELPTPLFGPPARIRVKEVYTVKPYSIARVPVEILTQGGAQTYMCQPTAQFREGQSLGRMAHTLIDGQHDSQYVEFINMDNAPIRLNKSDILGSAVRCTILETKVQEVLNAHAQHGSDPEFTDALSKADINPELSSEQRTQVERVLRNNHRAFAYGNRIIGSTDWVKLSVDTGDALPISQPPYHASPSGRKVIEETVQELEDLGIVEDSDSSWASPVVLVNQGDKVRFCVDYRRLNTVTKMDQYPIPRPDDILNAFSGKKWFSSFDANKGFHQTECATDEDKDKLAFRTHLGLKRFTRMPFGIHKGPGVFQRLTDKILGACKWQHALVYIDDIIIYSDTFEDHCKHLQDVLSRVVRSGITLAFKKSHIAHQRIQALGHTISDIGITTAPHNTDAIRAFPRPTTVKEIQRFIGMAVYYRRFIQDFARICQPLYALTKKDNTFIWTDEHEKAFNTLKEKLSTEPVLAHPDFNKDFIVHTDASLDGLGAVLSQLDGDGREHPICYLSRQLTATEQNYSATELECLGAVWAIKKWHAYLDGCKFKLVTDHIALQWLFSLRTANRRLLAWQLELGPYRSDMTIIHRAGRVHSNVDPLSRAAMPLTDALLGAQANTVDVQQHDTIQKIKVATEKDEYLQKIIDACNTQTLAPHTENFTVDNGLVYRTDKHSGAKALCVPMAKEVRLELLHDAHDAIISGHLGTAKTYARLQGLYWWPSMAKEVEEYVQSCASCQRNKSANRSAQALLRPINTPPTRWHTVTMDFTGPLPKTPEGYDMITAVIDKFTKRLHCYPSKTTDSAVDTATRFFNHIIKLHGVPHVIISDRDPKFTSQFWRSLCTQFGTKTAMSTAFHPQTDGQTERANRTIKEMLRHYTSGKTHLWDAQLPALEFAYNTSVHASTGFTPFELDTGRHPRSPTRLDTTDIALPVVTEEFLDHLSAIAHKAQQSIEKSQNVQANLYNQGRKPIVFNVGDEVRVSAKHINPPWLPRNGTRKLQPKYHGPYKIIDKVSDTAYTLDFPPSLKIHNTVNVEYLMPYKTSPEKFNGRTEVPPPPIEVNGEEEFRIDSIIAKRTRRNKDQYLVKWVGYPDEENTWLPQSEIEDTEAYENWLAQHAD